MWVGLNIIVGLPKETERDIQETIQFINNNIKYINTIYVTKYHLLFESILYKYAKEYGLTNIVPRKGKKLLEGAWDIFCFDEIDGRTEHDRSLWAEEAYRRVTKSFPVEKGSDTYAIKDRFNFLHYLLSTRKSIQSVEDIYYHAVRKFMKCAKLNYCAIEEKRKKNYVKSVLCVLLFSLYKLWYNFQRWGSYSMKRKSIKMQPYHNAVAGPV